MTLDVFGMKIKVVYKDLSEANLAGVFVASEKTIFIDNHQPKCDQEASLIHELTHAISYRAGWCQVLSKEVEEFICEHISSVILDNFKLTKKK